MVTCLYGRGPFLSGQRLASELLIDGLRARGWRVKVIQTPVLDRRNETQRQSVRLRITMAFRLASAWLQAIPATLGKDPLQVNVGQTRFALVRDGLPVLVRGLVGREGPIVLSLHGNFFAGWAARSLEARLLRGMARAASCVTVLGKAQVRRLADLGVPGRKIVVMDNTCLVAPLTEEECERKQTVPDDVPIRVLFLSNLVEDKGYPEFIEAIGVLAARTERPLHAILCGALLDAGPGERFRSIPAAREWIQRQCEEINGSRSVRIEWLPGVYDVDKEALLRSAHVLALPSKLEAQPIVLLEALASGCAAITTRVGMIPETVDADSAVLIDKGQVDPLAQAIESLALDSGRRIRMTRQALRLFRERFSYEGHLERWESIFRNVMRPTRSLSQANVGRS